MYIFEMHPVGDEEYYNAYGSEWYMQMRDVMNLVEGVFEDQLQVTFDIPSYTMDFSTFNNINDGAKLLLKLREKYGDQDMNTHMEQLFSGKILPFGGATIASAPDECVIRTTFDDGSWYPLRTRQEILQHELAHNFQGSHCEGQIYYATQVGIYLGSICYCHTDSCNSGYLIPSGVVDLFSNGETGEVKPGLLALLQDRDNLSIMIENGDLRL